MELKFRDSDLVGEMFAAADGEGNYEINLRGTPAGFLMCIAHILRDVEDVWGIRISTQKSMLESFLEHTEEREECEVEKYD
jgi:hypothetical protein